MDDKQYNIKNYPYGQNNSVINTYERKPLCTEMTVMEFQNPVPINNYIQIRFYMNYDKNKLPSSDRYDSDKLSSIDKSK